MAAAQKITADAAAAYLSDFELIDPEGRADLAQVCRAGDCFALDFADGRLVLVLERIGAALWITACAGRTRAAARATLDAVESYARALGARLVKFQTVRRGLVRLARRAGYVQNGFVLCKVLPC